MFTTRGERFYERKKLDTGLGPSRQDYFSSVTPKKTFNS